MPTESQASKEERLRNLNELKTSIYSEIYRLCIIHSIDTSEFKTSDYSEAQNGFLIGKDSIQSLKHHCFMHEKISQKIEDLNNA